MTQIHGGDTWNVIPDQVVLRGTCRWFYRTVRDLLEPAMRQIADGIAAAHRCSASLRYERRYPATVNAPAETAFAAGVAEALVGPEHVDRNF